MFKNSRFIHQQTPGGKFKGFSVLLHNEDGEGSVYYSSTFCSAQDTFSRAPARKACGDAQLEVCRIVDLPLVLAQLLRQCYGQKMEMYGRKEQRALANQYAWVYKYFL